ncbi:MAG TPA: hypothetical protein VF443_06295 [Nitrospira sp.]
MRALALGLLLACSVASAGTLRGNDENCRHLGRVFIQLAGQRDQGVTLSEMEQITGADMAEALGKPDSILQDQDDVAYVKSKVRELYGKAKDQSPVQVGLSVFLDCLGK